MAPFCPMGEVYTRVARPHAFLLRGFLSHAECESPISSATAAGAAAETIGGTIHRSRPISRVDSDTTRRQIDIGRVSLAIDGVFVRANTVASTVAAVAAAVAPASAASH